MQVKSAGGKEYEYIVMDDYTRAVYAGPLRLKSEAPEAFKVFKAVAENESQKRMRETLTDNARELCMGEMKGTCEREGIKLHMSVRYCPESNGVAERMIGVLTMRCLPCYVTPVSQIPVGRSIQHGDVRT